MLEQGLGAGLRCRLLGGAGVRDEGGRLRVCHVAGEDERLQRRAQVVAHRAREGAQRVGADLLPLEALRELQSLQLAVALGGVQQQRDGGEHLCAKVREREESELCGLREQVRLGGEPEGGEEAPREGRQRADELARERVRRLAQDVCTHAPQREEHVSKARAKPADAPSPQRGDSEPRDGLRHRRRGEKAGHHDADDIAVQSPPRLGGGVAAARDEGEAGCRVRPQYVSQWRERPPIRREDPDAVREGPVRDACHRRDSHAERRQPPAIRRGREEAGDEVDSRERGE
mmetsp:Transcript_35964/g.113149  ORF Transcript_35964/g.113149 Transcript_35964/m.113149 type:complete len:288 (+) Transcript_35964:632-1495(+)